MENLNETTPCKMRIIYGSPTVGKSYFGKEARSQGHIILDTDTVMEALHPDWVSKKGWRTEPNSDQAKRVLRDVGAHIRKLGSALEMIVITNLHGPEFLEELDPRCLVDGKIPIGFVRTSGGEINQISKERGGSEIPKNIAESWVNEQAREKLRSRVAVLIELTPASPHHYMSEYLSADGTLKTHRSDEWKISMKRRAR